MAEKRKPCFVFLLKNVSKDGKGKSKKVELFRADLWDIYYADRGKRYRLRVNGKWFPKGEMRFFWRTEIRDMLWRSIYF